MAASKTQLTIAMVLSVSSLAAYFAYNAGYESGRQTGVASQVKLATKQLKSCRELISSENVLEERYLQMEKNSKEIARQLEAFSKLNGLVLDNDETLCDTFEEVCENSLIEYAHEAAEFLCSAPETPPSRWE